MRDSYTGVQYVCSGWGRLVRNVRHYARVAVRDTTKPPQLTISTVLGFQRLVVPKLSRQCGLDRDTAVFGHIFYLLPLTTDIQDLESRSGTYNS
jgi:hypothetical protein